MVWPIDDLTTAHLDAGTDDPKQARPELLAAVNKFKTILGDPAITELATIAALKALATPSSALAVHVQGYAARGDGGGGLFWWDSASGDADNGGTIISPDSAPANGRWKRLYSGAVNVRWFNAKGDGIADDTTAINNAINTTLPVFFPNGRYLISSTLNLPRYTHLFGHAGVNQNSTLGAKSAIVTNNGSGIIIDSNSSIKGLIIESSTVAGTGLQCGKSGNFEAYAFIEDVTVRGYTTNVLIENAYFTKLENCSIDGGTKGVLIKPTSFSGGGYTTTVTLDKTYIHNCAQEGLKDESPVQSKVFHLSDCVVEMCGDATYPQIDLVAAQVAHIENLYLESSEATKPTGMKITKGTIKGLYVNGANIGVDAGASSCELEIDNAIFLGTTTSINVTGGSIAKLVVRRSQLDSAPNLSTLYAVFDHCLGTLPTGVTENSYEIIGTVPKFGIGGLSGSKIRQIRFYTFAEGGVSVTGNSTVDGSVQLVDSGAIANAVLSATPQSALPTGIVAQPYKVDNDRFRIRYINTTGTAQTVSNTWNVQITRFTS